MDQTNDHLRHSILIVEDDRDIRDTLQQVLELEGFVVHTAVNGKDGLEKLRKIDRPCLILLDLMMPVMNGWEFLEAQGQDGFLSKIPVVVVSAFSTHVPPAPRAVAFVKKPVEIETLLHRIQEHCLAS
jgi:CheY-like chemotaxis protein